MGKCICPKCKSENIVPIIYGYPSQEAFEDITYCDGRKKSHTGDIGGGTVDETIMNFLKFIPELKKKIEGEDIDE